MDSNIFKKRIDYYLNSYDTSASRAIQIFIMLVNISAIIHYIVEVDTLRTDILKVLQYLEIMIVLVFIAEYLLRLYSSENRLKYIFSLYSFFDLLSIIPIFFTVYKVGFLRILRVFRVLRFQKYLDEEYFFFTKIKNYQLQVIRIVFIIITIVFISSGLIYAVEGRDGTNVLKSFLDAVYFCVATVTTVGFGDFTPTTNSGKLITIGIIFSGVTLLPYHIGKLIKTIIETPENTNDNT